VKRFSAIVGALTLLLLLSPAFGQDRYGSLAEANLAPSVAISALTKADGEGGTLFSAALHFSGSGSVRAEATRRALEPVLAEARALASGHVDDYALGEALLSLAHERFLKRYVELESTLDAAVLDGRYNCVSSSVLYLLLAREAGLRPLGVVTTDHSFVALALRDGRLIDVETTNRHGFDPGSKKEFLDSFGRTTGYAYVPPSDYKRRSQVSDRHLVGLIALNRATLAERRADQLGALALAVDAHAYMDDDTSRQYLGDRAHNIAATLLNAKRWDEALRFLDRVTEYYGPLADLDKLGMQARLALLADNVSSLGRDEALAELERAYRAGVVSDSERAEFILAIVSRAADELRKREGWLAAWRALAEAAGDYPAIAQLRSLAATARSNWVADTHNRFAAHFNARRYDEAQAVLKEGLAIAPEEKLFIDDERALKSARAVKP
jgi:tetratricopeptide (TPR) repeat protein